MSTNQAGQPPPLQQPPRSEAIMMDQANSDSFGGGFPVGMNAPSAQMSMPGAGYNMQQMGPMPPPYGWMPQFPMPPYMMGAMSHAMPMYSQPSLPPVYNQGSMPMQQQQPPVLQQQQQQQFSNEQPPVSMEVQKQPPPAASVTEVQKMETSTVIQTNSSAISVNQSSPAAMELFSSPEVNISQRSSSVASSISRPDVGLTPEAKSYSDKARMAPQFNKDFPPLTGRERPPRQVSRERPAKQVSRERLDSHRRDLSSRSGESGRSHQSPDRRGHRHRSSSRDEEGFEVYKRKRPSQQARRQEQRHLLNRTEQRLPEKRTLQDYYTRRPPPPHPTDADLERLKVNESYAVDRIHYYKTAEGIVVTARNRHHVDFSRDSKSYVHSTGPQMPRINIRDEREILTPTPDLPQQLLYHDRLFHNPEVYDNKEHGGASKCFCGPQSAEFHVMGVLNSVCFPKSMMSIEESHSEFDFSFDKTSPNVNRCYLYSAKSRRPVLQVPSPHLLAWRWPERPYLAANATESGGLKYDLFYRLHSGELYRETVNSYTAGPKWDDSNHPMWSEPASTDELRTWSESMYGTESLFRVLFPRHPTRSDSIHVHSALTAQFRVPVITGSGEKIGILDEFLSERLRPFYSNGCGRIICPCCLLAVKDRAYVPCLFERKEFIEHFKKAHHRSVGVLGLSFSTHYHVRMYEAFLVYSMCMAHVKSDSEDRPSEAPFQDMDMSRFSVRYENNIRKLLIDKNQEELVKTHNGKWPLFGYSDSAQVPSQGTSGAEAPSSMEGEGQLQGCSAALRELEEVSKSLSKPLLSSDVVVEDEDEDVQMEAAPAQPRRSSRGRSKSVKKTPEKEYPILEDVSSPESHDGDQIERSEDIDKLLQEEKDE
jgi:hypothetical protein